LANDLEERDPKNLGDKRTVMKLYNTSHTHWKSMVDANHRPTQAQALARRLDEYRDELCK
jgi:hypothetical protein